MLLLSFRHLYVPSRTNKLLSVTQSLRESYIKKRNLVKFNRKQLIEIGRYYQITRIIDSALPVDLSNLQMKLTSFSTVQNTHF